MSAERLKENDEDFLKLLAAEARAKFDVMLESTVKAARNFARTSALADDAMIASALVTAEGMIREKAKSVSHTPAGRYATEVMVSAFRDEVAAERQRIGAGGGS